MTTKFLLALKFCKSAANVIFFFSGNPYLSKQEFFSKGNKKTENVWSSSFIRGTKTPKEVWVCVTVFKRKIGTMPLGYFSLVALYYCNICEIIHWN